VKVEVLKPFQQAHRGSLSDVVIALDLQPFDGSENRRQIAYLAPLDHPDQVPGKVGQNQVKRQVVSLRPPLVLERLPLRSKRRAGCEKHTHHVVFGDHPAEALVLPNGGDQRLATLDFPSESILSRVRCIASFGLAR
jgi:hypothetical protein